MIQETITYHCRKCGSPNIVKNGHNQCGNPQYHCKDCGAYRTLKPKQRYTPEEREQILKVYQERASMRAIQRVYGVSRSTLANWIKKSPQFTCGGGDRSAGSGTRCVRAG